MKQTQHPDESKQGFHVISPPVAPVMPASGPLKNDLLNNLCLPHPIAFFGLCPCCLCASCPSVREKTEVVLLNFGKYMGTLRVPGLYWVNPCITQREVAVGQQNTQLEKVKVADLRGNPLILSGVVTYRIIDSKKAVLEVDSATQYVQTQALAVMKKVASLYPYESHHDEQPSLKTEAELVKKQMEQYLQERVAPAGVQVLSFELTDLSYAPEIAQAMLIRQQAEALMEARKIIVEGAVNIAHDAVAGLTADQIAMTPPEQAQLVTNLLVTICGDTAPHPVIAMT